MTEDYNDPIDELLPKGAGRWNVIANIVRRPRAGVDPEKIYFGTKVYAPGAKIHMVGWIAGVRDKFAVLGVNRKSKRNTLSIIDIRLIENFRVKFLYSPDIIKRLLSAEPLRTENLFFEGKNGNVGKLCLVKSNAECKILAEYYSELSLRNHTKAMEIERQIQESWSS